MIGIFDSGSGGLTVLRALRKKLPEADVVYFGDIKNAPYGSKSRTELSQLAFADIKFLLAHGATKIVSACNSTSASLAIPLLETNELGFENLIEMVGPTVRYFKYATANILLCATPATIQSGIYQDAFAMLGKNVQAVSIPDLAAAIEFGKPDSDIENIIKEAFATIPKGSFKIVILACTHYPLVLNIFERVLGHDVLIFDPADAVAERIEELWWPQEIGNGISHFFISADSQHFRDLLVKNFNRDSYSIEVIH